MVGNIRKGAGRGAGPRHADAEVFQSAGGVYFPVSAVKQIVYAVNLIAFRCPEASHAPAGGFFAQSGAATLPELQIFGSVNRKTAAVLARTIEVIAPIRSAQNEWVGAGNGSRIVFCISDSPRCPKKSFPMFPCLRRPAHYNAAAVFLAEDGSLFALQALAASSVDKKTALFVGPNRSAGYGIPCPERS